MNLEPSTSGTRQEEAALKYLRAGSGEPWRWTDDGHVLAWTADGGTVAFRDELLAILDALAPRGLPPFAALALLLAACRGRVPALDDLLGPEDPVTLPPSFDAHLLGTLRGDLRRRCADTLQSLADLKNWPKGLLATSRAKSVLAEAVFEQAAAQVCAPDQARHIVVGLRDGVLPESALNRPTGRRFLYLTAFHALEGLRNLTPAQLALRLSTGLDELPDPAPLPDETFQPPAGRARLLLETLRADPEHAGLARAARDLLAALSLPRRLPESDDFALGGVADIANRGSLDKLLLSELAHDDLTLATRVALNEALYLRREPPVAPESLPLALLIDAGIRTWGTPRLFAASAALAFCAADPRRPACQAWRADNTEAIPVDLLTIDGFKTHLAALTPDAHPGAALPAFFAALSGNPVSPISHLPSPIPPPSSFNFHPSSFEAILLTHRDTLADPAFRRALDAHPAPPGVRLYLATVERDGVFELLPYPLVSGKLPLCRATIRLDEIYGSPKPARTQRPPSLLDPNRPTGLPVILSLPTFPFRLPVRGGFRASCSLSGGGTVTLIRRRELLSWNTSNFGAQILARDLPAGRTLLLQPETTPDCIHVLSAAWHQGSIPLSTYDAVSGTLHTQRLALNCPPSAARVEEGVILLFYPRRMDVYRLRDGQKLKSVAAPGGVYWDNGRYYRRVKSEGYEWFFATWNGLNAVFHRITDVKDDLVCVFDQAGSRHPWGLSANSEVRDLESGSVHYQFIRCVPQTPNRTLVSQDGFRLLLYHPETRSAQLIDLGIRSTSKLAWPLATPASTLLERPAHVPDYPLMNRFTEIRANPEVGVQLRHADGRYWHSTVLHTCSVGLRRFDRALSNSGPERPFQPVRLPGKAGYKLREARWPDGSRAFLDNRGLLHLKSSDPALPEISLTLTASPGAIWTSDGQTAGAKFFFGPDHKNEDATALLPLLTKFSQRLS